VFFFCLLLTTVLNLWALVPEVYSCKKFVSVVKDRWLGIIKLFLCLIPTFSPIIDRLKWWNMYRYKLGIKSGCIKVKQLWYLKVDKILVCDLLFYHVTIIIVMAESAVFTFGFPKSNMFNLILILYILFNINI